MKNLKYFVVVLALLTTSCENKFEKQLSKLDGVWKLTEMTYTDTSGVVQTIFDSETVLHLNTGENTSSEVSPTSLANVGIIKYPKGESEMVYHTSGTTLDIDFDTVNQREIFPIDVPNADNTYEYQVEGDYLDMTIDWERYQSGEDFYYIKNVSYRFEKQ